MLRITADLFSGRPNPVAEVSDAEEVRSTLRQLSRLPQRPPDPGGGLGLRGFQVEVLDDELSHQFGLGSGVYLPAGAGEPELAERLVGLMERGEARSAVPGTEAQPMESGLRDYILGQLEGAGGTSVQDQAGATAAGEDDVAAQATCWYELGVFNPGFWNDNAYTRAHNNCYNYASNWRTNTFAQPGLGCGDRYHQITCAEVTRGALCDGMHRRYDCFPDSEKPRYLVALVVAPDPWFNDFHWYRKQKEGFWGHKPGGAEARNYDNSNNVVYNPETADRGPYTLFCGYFYGCNSQRVRIR